MEGSGGVGLYPKPYTLNRYLYNVLEPAFSCGGYALQLRTAELPKSGLVGIGRALWKGAWGSHVPRNPGMELNQRVFRTSHLRYLPLRGP